MQQISITDEIAAARRYAAKYGMTRRLYKYISRLERIQSKQQEQTQ